MTVTLSSAGGSSVPNWTLLQTATPTAVSTYTFSGLSGYSKYRIVTNNLICTTGLSNLQLRLNGDSGANYNSWGVTYNATAGTSFQSIAATQIAIGTLFTSAYQGTLVDIDHALLLTPKVLSINFGNSNPQVNVLSATYVTTSALTSITVLLATNNFSTGTITLLGAN